MVTNNTTQDSNLLNADQAAARLGFSKRYLELLVKRKALPVVRFGRKCVRFQIADLDAYTAAHTVNAREV